MCRVRGRPRREEVRCEQPEQSTPPTPSPPPPPPSPTLPFPSPTASPERQDSQEVSGDGPPLPQAPIADGGWRRLTRNIDDIRQRNDYLQEQLEYYLLERQDEGEREAEAVAEFEPFSAVVREVAIPDNMKSLALEAYSGGTDPKDHLLYFSAKMVISVASDAMKCRMFPSTFKGTTMAWFTTLPRGSIAKFSDFSSKFLVQFSASKIKQVTIDDMFNVRQLERETLKQYMKRYSAASIKIEELEPQACARAFKNGLLPGNMNSKLSRKPARSMTEIRARANAYILDEEDDAFKRKRARAEKVGGLRDMISSKRQGWKKEKSRTRRDKRVTQTEDLAKAQLYSKKEKLERRRPWQPVGPRRPEVAERDPNAELRKLLRKVKATHAVEGSSAGISSRRGAIGRAKWCEYHRSAGHDTGDCFTLKGEIGRLIRAGRSQMTNLGPGKGQQGRSRRDGHQRTLTTDEKETLTTRRKGPEETFDKDLKPLVGTVNTIVGGFGGGGDTPSARRRHARAVASVQEYVTSFGFRHPDIVISSADFQGIKTNRDDHVVIMVRINSFNVRRVLLDQGSSADIIYGDAFEQLGLTDRDLMPYTGTLVGFSGERVWVRGYLDLDTIFGIDENAKLLRVRYLVWLWRHTMSSSSGTL
ncbi:uncharacterized protein LOC130725292 [Lotus japonicus]|uniref:uncharacterized protein LOC130725292 n=1 Tax=Lotus japonicus TaxID=34305 RepID=UPI00258A7D36|nr:uncharacterized protein LOC130725292 [Lotus japonicus]